MTDETSTDQPDTGLQGVTAAAGFRAAGVTAGLKTSGKPDVALVVNDGPDATAAAVFTSNRAQAHPVIWSRQVVGDGVARAVVLNSGGANCFTGPFGFQTTHMTAEAVGAALGIGAGDVVVCSTGLIGRGDQTFRDGVLRGVDLASAALAADGGPDAAVAIMTTDTTPKQSVVTEDGWTVGGMAKGAGMLAPGLATMLVVITTDAVQTAEQLDQALRAATRVTFDRVDSDGCMSTNDTVVLLSSGASGVTPEVGDFQEALTAVCADLARQLQQDAEGASHDITIEVTGAVSEDEAVTVGRSVARNNLFKAAVFGNDPNWGRVLAAIGTTDAEFDPYAVDVSMNGVRVCHAGAPDRPIDEVDLTPRDTHVLIELGVGVHAATILTNDLTHDYVHENSAYSS
ncbi:MULTISPECIES: bifunctional glutamate N-acetyltransferase/amino-acid acetyltransferase ArgJ [unclassified Curtobacterium]|uniref:bifunctional glutamate N-acetyltransferase/amino-acid acetyltransferase ArgJ n=1 Tax=unclassified Curtobacterium TaxID=257496 RepID=UPI00203D7792|nr:MULTISPECIES: bifunctional glutamate N-acetyltransferase/amino-acid acetyltransferase ArgJ [unclassified Curtobacterium]MCM3506601.1 bifunctional glutamate N-acetyltransferase/amino-acid acetyltransferase ArgJ [Curtobacterium sp. ODYSSEY 48 V2]MCM3522795.1 bifunctional glutamate N-acetyltransferase/amino-acid acetyltransferase ArgJ [Curtobacterium sp. P97]MDB6426607.1 bifunctional glutamate N-acetyltransferase/amino-acid acetyltransferase ArgJ [Curtobacterium sp. 20TX0008]